MLDRFHHAVRLSRQPQDMESYRYGIVNMGAPSVEELDQAFEEGQRLLTFTFSEPGGLANVWSAFQARARQRPLAT